MTTAASIFARTRTFLALLLAGPLITACGAGAAEVLRPTEPTAGDALGEASCREIERGGDPLIVDWKSEQRGELEVAMRTGVAVVAYTCKSIKVLPDCKLEGEYGFVGMTRREQVVRLKGADELRANLPFSGGAIGGELKRDATLDIAMMLVGKLRTTWGAPTRHDLKGTCDGATHFVRGALVGAFAMTAGTDAKVRAAAEIFGMGTHAASTSSKQAAIRDGDVADCQKATPDAEKAPAQCGAPIRLVLAPLPKGDGGAAPKPAAAPQVTAASEATECPKGLVFAESKCTRPEQVKAYECSPAQLDQCKLQCSRGDAASCGHAGASLAERREESAARELLRKACDGGHMRSCANLGALFAQGRGGSTDVAAAVPLFEQSCSAGDAVGCRELGRTLAKDPTRATSLFKLACNGGDDQACGDWAKLLDDGIGVPQDRDAAARLYKRACDGSQAWACASAGKHFAVGPAKNEVFAASIFRRGCLRGHAASCLGLARTQFAQQPDEAKRNLQFACSLRDSVACATAKVLFNGQITLTPSPALVNELTTACRGIPGGYDCVSLGALDVARGQAPAAKFNLQAACNRGDAFACALAKKLP